MASSPSELELQLIQRGQIFANFGLQALAEGYPDPGNALLRALVVLSPTHLGLVSSLMEAFVLISPENLGELLNLQVAFRNAGQSVSVLYQEILASVFGVYQGKNPEKAGFVKEAIDQTIAGGHLALLQFVIYLLVYLPNPYEQVFNTQGLQRGSLHLFWDELVARLGIPFLLGESSNKSQDVFFWPSALLFIEQVGSSNETAFVSQILGYQGAISPQHLVTYIAMVVVVRDQVTSRKPTEPEVTRVLGDTPLAREMARQGGRMLRPERFDEVGLDMVPNLVNRITQELLVPSIMQQGDVETKLDLVAKLRAVMREFYQYQLCYGGEGRIGSRADGWYMRQPKVMTLLNQGSSSPNPDELFGNLELVVVVPSDKAAAAAAAAAMAKEAGSPSSSVPGGSAFNRLALVWTTQFCMDLTRRTSLLVTKLLNSGSGGGGNSPPSPSEGTIFYYLQNQMGKAISLAQTLCHPEAIKAADTRHVWKTTGKEESRFSESFSKKTSTRAPDRGGDPADWPLLRFDLHPSGEIQKDVLHNLDDDTPGRREEVKDTQPSPSRLPASTQGMASSSPLIRKEDVLLGQVYTPSPLYTLLNKPKTLDTINAGSKRPLLEQQPPQAKSTSLSHNAMQASNKKRAASSYGDQQQPEAIPKQTEMPRSFQSAIKQRKPSAPRTSPPIVVFYGSDYLDLYGLVVEILNTREFNALKNKATVEKINCKDYFMFELANFKKMNPRADLRVFFHLMNDPAKNNGGIFYTYYKQTMLTDATDNQGNPTLILDVAVVIDGLPQDKAREMTEAYRNSILTTFHINREDSQHLNFLLVPKPAFDEKTKTYAEMPEKYRQEIANAVMKILDLN